MTCITTLPEIRQRLASLSKLAHVVDILKFIATSSKAADKSKMNIRRQWTNIRSVFEGRPIPSHARLQEALRRDASTPSPDSCIWLQELAESRDLDAPEVGAIAGEYSRKRSDFNLAMQQLPRRLRNALGPNCSIKRRPWVVRARLRKGVSEDDLDDALAVEVRGGGGPSAFVRECSNWGDIKPLLTDPKWEIEWPDIDDILERFKCVLDEREEAGEDDFAATPGDVKTVVLEVFDKHHPEWLPRDNSETAPRHRDQLLAGLLDPPVALRRNNLENAVCREFEPEAVSGLLKDVLRLLLDEGKITLRFIEYLIPGTHVPVRELFLAWGSARTGATDVAAREQLQPLTDTQQDVFDIIEQCPEGRGLTGSQILEKLRQDDCLHETTQGALTSHIIPALKSKRGVINTPGVGYHIP